VGLDDFAARLIGRADRIDAPPVGATVQAGHALLTLVRRGRRTAVVAPVSGAVAAVNRDALVNPGTVVEDPYGDGWLIDIRGADLPQEFRSLLTGEMARRLIDDAAGALHTYLSPVPLQAAADGGQAVDGIADMLDEQTWDRARTRFLLTDPE
jgi:glycine cleavage system H protein